MKTILSILSILSALVCHVPALGVLNTVTAQSIIFGSPPVPPVWTLTRALSLPLQIAETNSAATGSYLASDYGLGTNSAVWTWPINLSCVGYDTNGGYSTVLLTSNTILSNVHFGGLLGYWVSFKDTNGVICGSWVTNETTVIADMMIGTLSNALPSSVVPPLVFLPSFTNYLVGHSVIGLPGFWPHHNASQVESVVVIGAVNEYLYDADADGLNFGVSGVAPFSGTIATQGDSGSPFFLAISNQPVLCFALTTPSLEGAWLSGPTNFAAIAALGLTNGMRFVDTSSFPIQ